MPFDTRGKRRCLVSMNLSVPWDGPLGESLTRTVIVRITEGATELAGVNTDAGERVHRARVALKRARSTLRLLEQGGASWARPLRHRLAALARELSEARESAVTAMLAERLRRRQHGQEKAVLILLRDDAGPRPLARRKRLTSDLRHETEALLNAEAPAISRRKVRRFLSHSIGRVARRHGVAIEEAAVEKVHAWRKAVIVLRDQLRLVQALWPEVAGAAYLRLARFADRLGRFGDLGLLGRRLQSLEVPADLEPACQRLIQRLDAQRTRAVDLALRGWPRLESNLRRQLG